MNPSVRLILLAALFVACGRSQFPPEPGQVADPQPGEPEDVIVEVGVGAIGHCTRSQRGRVQCEGSAADGRLRFTLVEEGARALSVGGSLGYCGAELSACALMDDGRILCASRGTHVCEARQNEVRIEGVRAITVGDLMGCALTEAGAVQCSDELFEGRLRTIPGMQGSIEISCGRWACCGVTAGGDVSCLRPGAPDALPVPLPAPAVQVTVGARHACALDASGSAHCWADAPGGQPSTPPGLARFISAGGETTCALDAGGLLRCTRRSDTTGPFDFPLVHMEAGASEVCGLEADGTIHCAALSP